MQLILDSPRSSTLVRSPRKLLGMTPELHIYKGLVSSELSICLPRPSFILIKCGLTGCVLLRAGLHIIWPLKCCMAAMDGRQVRHVALYDPSGILQPGACGSAAYAELLLCVLSQTFGALEWCST